MRPAVAAIAARAAAQEWPSMAEYRALLDEAGTDAAEAQALTRRYAAAVGSIESRTSGESKVLAALRGFTLPQ